MKGDGVPERQAVPFQPVRVVAQAAAKLVDEPGLADPRLADDEDDLTLPSLDLGEGVEKKLELALAPDKRSEPVVGSDLQPGPGLPRGQDLPRADRLRLPLEGQFGEGPRMEVARDEAVGRLRDDDATGLGRLLEARGDVRRVADRRVVHAEVVSDTAHDDEAGVDALPDLEGQPLPPLELLAVILERRPDPDGGVDGPASVLLVSDGGAEEGHDAVAEELVHGPFVAVDLGQHQLEGARHDGVDVLRIEPLGERGESGNVDEEDRDLLSLTLECRARSEDLIREVLGRIGLGGSEAGLNARLRLHRGPASVAESRPRWEVRPA
jgi:hypothetical protein